MGVLGVFRLGWVARVVFGGYMLSWVGDRYMLCGRVGVWGGGVVFTGIFRWLLGCGGGSGLVRSLGFGGSVWSFAGGCCCR